MHTVGRDPNSQMAAIGRAGWASSGYGGGSELNQLYNQYGRSVKVPSVPKPQAQQVQSKQVPVQSLNDKLTALLGPNQIPSSPFKLPPVTVTEKVAKAPGLKIAPAQSSDPTKVKGVASFEGRKVAAWIAPILSYARQHGWRGSINSGYRSYQDQLRIWNSGVRPAARPGTSNHEMTAFPGGAIDVNGAEQLSSIIARSPYKGLLVWAGAKDPVHFSHPHNGSY
jgi:hypothetical protein